MVAFMMTDTGTVAVLETSSWYSSRTPRCEMEVATQPRSGLQLVSVPLEVAIASQEYYWTEEWQKGEREVAEDIRLGRTRSFSSIEDAIAWLDDDEGLHDMPLVMMDD